MLLSCNFCVRSRMNSGFEQIDLRALFVRHAELLAGGLGWIFTVWREMPRRAARVS